METQMPNLQFYSLRLGKQRTWTSMGDICQDVEDNSFLLFLITLTFPVYHSFFVSSQPNYHFIIFVQFQCVVCVIHTRLTNSLNIFLLLETILVFFLSWGRGLFLGGSDGKESACNDRDLCSIPGLGRSPGEGNGNPLQDSCLENSMDRGAWWAVVHGDLKIGYD